jgi:hypothetical protein
MRRAKGEDTTAERRSAMRFGVARTLSGLVTPALVATEVAQCPPT